MITCTCCGGSGRRVYANGVARKCRGCGGAGRRPPPRKSAPPALSASPWGRTPSAATTAAVRNWDWEGAARKAAVVNALRAARGQAPLPTPTKKEPTP